MEANVESASSKQEIYPDLQVTVTSISQPFYYIESSSSAVDGPHRPHSSSTSGCSNHFRKPNGRRHGDAVSNTRQNYSCINKINLRSIRDRSGVSDASCRSNVKGLCCSS
ncbi:hypothetical protein OIU76_012396 [Salix suchowensis]|nr:hypothetical protein OIU76_012396 [Salix suchowensis]